MTDTLQVEQFGASLGLSSGLITLAALIALVFIAFVANFIVKKILLRFFIRLLNYTRYGSDQTLKRFNVTSRLANIVPALVVMGGIKYIPGMPETLAVIVENVGNAFILLTIALGLSEFLNIVNALYMRRPDAFNKPIKGYLQILKIAIAVVTVILIISTLIDKSPLILLSGLGAMAAVLMLVFQDTLLSLVASVQISSADMLRVGDWIEMPQLNADGDVIDIALHTVKVQNWDKTITTIPTRRLVNDPFKNWRGMRESGGRRIKRAIYLDQNSIHFLTEEEKDHLKRFALLTGYLQSKEQELVAWNKKIEEESHVDPINARRLTNIGTFRAYVEQYLKNYERINQRMIAMVRQLNPGPNGLPIEVYCFTNTTGWVEYEAIQSDVFDHLYSILPEFGLRAYQQPSGYDLMQMSQELKPHLRA